MGKVVASRRECCNYRCQNCRRSCRPCCCRECLLWERWGRTWCGACTIREAKNFYEVIDCLQGCNVCAGLCWTFLIGSRKVNCLIRPVPLWSQRLSLRLRRLATSVVKSFLTRLLLVKGNRCFSDIPPEDISVSEKQNMYRHSFDTSWNLESGRLSFSDYISLKAQGRVTGACLNNQLLFSSPLTSTYVQPTYNIIWRIMFS